jgi:hypothetical protein
MLFMIIEHFKNGDAAPVYRRFREKGRMAPEGLAYVASWVTEDRARCFQVMECDDRKLLDEWMARWSDLVRFEVIPVVTSAQAAAGFADFQVLEFAKVDEAAAFIAALSRFLASPRGAQFLVPPEGVEIASRATQAPGFVDVVEVYLSDAAWRAANAAFAPVPAARPRAREALPADRVVVVHGRTRVALGLEEVRRRLAPAS